MQKNDAIRKIYNVVNKRTLGDLSHSEFMRNELLDILEFAFEEDNVSRYELIEFKNGFYIGDVVDGMWNGYGAVCYADTDGLYVGEWKNGKKHGRGFCMMPKGVCYCGEFYNDAFNGEGTLASRDKVEFSAIFENGEIKKVRTTISAFTYRNKHYDENGRLVEESGGCMTWVALLLIIGIGLGIYSYCSNWKEEHDHAYAVYNENDDSAKTYICDAQRGLIVRLSNSKASQKIGYIAFGDEVEVLEFMDDFAKIEFKGTVGFVASKYLSLKKQ